MDANLARELPVEVVRSVERLMGVLNVVRRHRCEEDRVAGRRRNISGEPFERAAQIAKFFGFAPRQRAVTLQRRHAELFDRRAIFARQRGEGIWTELGRTEIEEMTRIV